MTRRRTLNVRSRGLTAASVRIPGFCGTTYCLTCDLMTPQIFQSGRSQTRSFVVWRCMRCSHDNRTP
jgi:RNase P subunit RPR2